MENIDIVALVEAQPSEVYILAGGLAISSFTQLAKKLQEKTGWDIFLPKNLAMVISLIAGLAYAIHVGGSFKEFAQNLVQFAVYAWTSGQGVYQLVKASKTKEKK